MKSAALFVVDVWTSILVPPFFYILILITIVWWVVTALYLYTVGQLDKTNSYPFG